MSTSNKIIELLNKKIKKKSLYDKLLTEEGTYAGLSVGDLFYDYLKYIQGQNPLIDYLYLI